MSALAPTQMTCPRCRAPLPAAWAWRLCPGCLLRSGLGADEAAGRAPAAEEAEAWADFPQSFGRYELLGELGRGGQGRVFRAREPGLGRVVALKLLRGGRLAEPEERARFEAEARAMAAVRHPNLVVVHEVGEAEGQPYCAMEFIAGRDLGEIAAAGPVAPRQAAAWLRTVAEAVQAAHDRGVLHRDLKPSNIIVDEAGVPHVTDFGLARRLDETPALTLTLSHQALGSPHYMPPEQAAGRRDAAGPAADVYGLGAILYHLLTGRPPFEGGSTAEVLRLVLDAEVIPPRRLRPAVPAALETVCLKALRKAPAARYPTARALADDLGRWLAGEPVLARPVSPAERAWLWCRRRPALAAALVACAALLLILAVGGPLAALSIQRSRVAAEQAEAARREQLRAALLAKAAALRRGGQPGQREAALAAIAEAVALRPGADARNEAIAALARPDARLLRVLDLGRRAVVFDRELRRYAVADAAGNLHVHAVADDRALFFLPAHRVPGRDGPVLVQFGFSPEGDELGASHLNGDLLAWRLEAQPDHEAARAAGGPALAQPGPARPRVLRLPYGARDGRTVPGTRWFVSDAADGVLRFYDRDTLAEAHRLPGPLRLADVKFSPAGGRFAVRAGTRVEIRNLSDGAAARSWDAGRPIVGLEWHPDGVQLATWSDGRMIGLWNADTGASAGTLAAHEATVVGAAFDARGRWLVTTSWDNQTLLWDVASQQPLLRLPQAGNHLQFSPDGRRLAYQLWNDDRWYLWELPEPGVFTRREMPAAAAGPAGNRDLWVAAFAADGTPVGMGESGLAVWPAAEVNAGRFLAGTFAHQAEPLAGDGLLLAAEAEWRALTPDGRLVPPLDLPPAPGTIRSFSVASDSQRIAAVTGVDGRLHLLDRPAAMWRTTDFAGLERVSLDAAGRRLAASPAAGGALLWPELGAAPLTLSGGPLHALRLSPDGRWLAAGALDRFTVHEAASGRLAWERPRRSVNLPMLTWSPDSRRLLVNEVDGAMHLLDAETGRAVAEFPAPPLVRVPAFSADGRRLAVPGEKSGLDLWDLGALAARLGELGLAW